MKKIISRIPLLPVLFAFFLVLGFVNFGSNLRSEFMIDDHDLILNQVFVESPKLSNIYQHFIPDFKAQQKIENSPSAVYYRPIAHILPFLQALVFGQDPFGYHFTNVVLFAVACLCFYILLLSLTGNRQLAFVAATLFCLHPINGLMVNYITASVFAAQLIFLSLAIVLAIHPKPKFGFLPVALILFILALFCHETSLMLPAYVFLIFWYRKRNVWEACKKATPFLSVAVIYLGMRFYFASIQKSLLSKIGLYTDLNLLSYVGTFTKALLWYFDKLITMQGIVLMWSTPLVNNMWLWVPGFLLSLILLGILLRKWKADQKFVFLCWFILGLPPVALGCMISPHSGMMIEVHWLFFASLGLFALFAAALIEVSRKLDGRLRLSGFIIVCVVYLMASWNNNTFWKDELTYSQYWAKEVPSHKSLGFYVANAFLKKNNLPEAKKWFLQSLSTQWIDWQNYNNLAEIALEEKDETQALAYFQKALAVFPQSATVNNNLGSYYLKKKDFLKAAEYLEQARKLNPYQPEALLNLGLVFEQQDRWAEVWESYLKAYALRPKDERVLAALLQTALNGHGHDEIIVRAEEFLKDIRSEALLTSLGAQLAMSSRNELAMKYFQKAIHLYPQSSAAYRDAGKVLANTGDFQQAEKMWNAGWRINSADQEFKYLLERLAEIKAQPKD